MVISLRSIHRPLAVVVVLAGLSACSSPGDAPASTSVAAVSPTSVVETLVQALQAGDFDTAAAVTVDGHAALLTLAEGADTSEVASALADPESPVTANFWSGFAQTLSDPVSLDGVATEGEVVEEGSRRFLRVALGSSDARSLVLTEDGGWKIDLLATFGPALADRLIAPVEGALSSADTDAATVLAALIGQADSLRFAAQDESLPETNYQSLLALIERIARAG